MRSSNNSKLEAVLASVQKPARYTGGEYNRVVKDRNMVDVRVALCFPDTYEIGMSNLGMRILYGAANAIDGVWCERAFAPWCDMAERMRGGGMLLYGLESGDPVREFDIVAFSIGYELSYANVLSMIDLAGLRLRASDRGEADPILIAGGTCCFNPEPLADFFDLFVIGEGEEAICEIIESYRKKKATGHGKKELLDELSSLRGVYVPSLYTVEFAPEGTVTGIEPIGSAPIPVMKRIVADLDSAYFPLKTIIPSTGIVHDRVALELFRGCVRGCRFCQAGFIYRPVRARSADVLVGQGIEAINNSGYDEISLLSLSTGDYEDLEGLCDGLLRYCEPRMINLSLPSLRADSLSGELMQRMQKVRRAGLTIAPEAGSQRLRDVINKNITEQEILDACKTAFEAGWSSIKLYFMLGLPTETDDDIVAIANLSHTIYEAWKQHSANKARGARITVSTSCFIPKPHTPFQWEAQITMEEYLRKVKLLKSSIRSKAIVYNWHSPEQAYIEAALARGDRRQGRVVEEAFRLGAGMDSWSEFFSLEKWSAAFEICGLDPGFYALRKRDVRETLPWGHISCGVSDEYLRSEYAASQETRTTPDCRTRCSACGVAMMPGGIGNPGCSGKSMTKAR